MHAEPFRAWLARGRLKATRQREEIFKIFLSSSGHKTLPEIHAQVIEVHPNIGVSTVYRTLKLLTRMGLAEERKFGDGETQYEPRPQTGHHDHLICLDCGKIIEFEDGPLEALQKSIAGRYRFKLSHHRMELYGHCPECRGKKAPKGRG